MKRALDNPEFQPAERDAKAIRNTVFILVAIMLLGGLVVVWKYREKLIEDHKEVVKGRSSMQLGNVRKNFQTKGLDGEIYTFNILEGKVTLMAVISVNLPEESQVIIDEMKLAAEHFSGEERLQMVCISADAESEVSVKELNEFAKKAGIPEKGWYVLTAENENFGGFIKDGLKLGMISKVDKVTKEKVLPDLLRIVDPALNLRGEIGDFTFIAYHADKARAEDVLLSDASAEEKKQAEEVRDNILSYQRNRMYKYVNYILEHEEQDASFSEKNNSNRYNVPLMVFGGFILFILFMGYRLKKQRA